MAKPARKWILIPEYRPLFAMQECFGPQHGPLKEPCPTPIPIIGKLLRQVGDNKLTIYEVKKNPDKTTTTPVLLTLDNYTLSYDEIVGGAKVDPGPSLASTQKEPEAVPPVIGNLTATPKAQEPVKAPEPEPVVEDEPQEDPAPVKETEEVIEQPEPEVEETTTDDPVETGDEVQDDADVTAETEDVEQDENIEEPASATVETEQETLPPEPEVTVTSNDGVEVEGISPKVKPYAQMSKKERKEARRREAEAAAKAGTADQSE